MFFFAFIWSFRLKSVFLRWENILKSVFLKTINRLKSVDCYMLYRKITSYIEEYLKSDTDKILILEGARQVGKSFSIREVGQHESH